MRSLLVALVLHASLPGAASAACVITEARPTKVQSRAYAYQSFAFSTTGCENVRLSFPDALVRFDLDAPVGGDRYRVVLTEDEWAQIVDSSPRNIHWTARGDGSDASATVVRTSTPLERP